MNRLTWKTGTALAALLVASCTVGPDYVRPETPVPESFRTSADQPSLPPPPTRWWTEFQSPELNSLVDEALANNHDLRAAVQRIAQAEAKAGVEAGALLPDLKLSGSGSARAPKGGVGSVQTATTETERSDRTYQVGLKSSYELDFWGKNRKAMEAALATAQASVFDRETVAMTLVSDVATAYFQYLQGCDRVLVAEANVDNMKRVLEKVKRRRAVGEGSDLEVASQSAMLSQAEATLPILNLARDQQFHRLALLLGRAPNDLKLGCRPLASVAIPTVRPGLPSELLLRRPDIRKAESDMVAANANIGMARAKLYPSISLTGERGYGSKELINVMSPISMFWTVTASLAQTLFDNGKTQSEIAYYEARWGELVETYRKSIFSSLRDVEDALSSIHHYADRDEASTQRLRHAREAKRLSERSFGIGIIDYLSVLETERTQYNAEDELVQARFARLTAAINLYKAMGGGLEEPPPPTETPAAEGPKESTDANG
ncbi:efflux transporter outer membrane subunit [Magnetospirillum moscoviense]|uniref:efflux transporter outer membrane subunit n=1 Tax=Magnetospirillum moscoviense TaxID=1437059 RepID=UPI0009EEEB46|nr:efflux transporter outer membrane subunit [Magnetospirillum moscoviense]MBF0326611.1 efflux transporter outer membrane subunit [Alphaproteobacteria bacterium]